MSTDLADEVHVSPLKTGFVFSYVRVGQIIHDAGAIGIGDGPTGGVGREANVVVVIAAAGPFAGGGVIESFIGDDGVCTVAGGQLIEG